MKPSKTLTYLTLAAAVIGGGGYAYVASQRSNPTQADQVAVTAESSASTSVTPTPTATPTETPAVSTNLEQETQVLENEFNAVSESDFSTSDLNDSSLGL